VLVGGSIRYFFQRGAVRERTVAAVMKRSERNRRDNYPPRDCSALMAQRNSSGDSRPVMSPEPNMSQAAAVELYTATGALREEEPWADIQKVTYELKPPAVRTMDGGKELFRSVTRTCSTLCHPTCKTKWMMSDVQDIKFECFDGIQWLDNWIRR